MENLSSMHGSFNFEFVFCQVFLELLIKRYVDSKNLIWASCEPHIVKIIELYRLQSSCLLYHLLSTAVCISVVECVGDVGKNREYLLAII